MTLAEQLAEQVRLKIEKNQLILPSPPEILLLLKRLSADPDANLTALIDAIKKDPVLVLRVIRVANSSAIYMSQNPIGNVSQAITRLGMKLVNTLVISHELLQMFSGPPGRFTDFTRQVHQHSLKVASFAYALAKQHSHIDPDEALMAGLIHDIGYLPLLQVAKDFPNEPVDELLNALHSLHIEVGHELAVNWKFPEQICNAIKQHENYSYRFDGKPDLTEILIVANLSAYSNRPVPETEPEFIPALDKLEVDRNTPIEMHQHLNEDYHCAMQILDSA